MRVLLAVVAALLCLSAASAAQLPSNKPAATWVFAEIVDDLKAPYPPKEPVMAEVDAQAYPYYYPDMRFRATEESAEEGGAKETGAGEGAAVPPGAAYQQYGFPYSTHPPIPPPMPTYLPPPPYVPLPTAGAGDGGQQEA